MLCAHQIKMDDQASRGVKIFNTVNFLYTINVINVELSMMTLLIQLCLIILFSVNLTYFKVTTMLDSFWLTWKMCLCNYQCWFGRPVDCPACQKLWRCGFLWHYTCYKCQILHDTTHWALLAHTILSDIGRISLSQECQTILTENVMFSFD